MEYSVIIENLNFVYNPKSKMKKQALKDVNLKIKKGDFFGIIGHTGSGKSTLIQHLNGLIIPQSGKVTVGGIEVKEKSPELKHLRAKCGMVFQYPEYQLFGETVAEDIAFGLINFFAKNEKGEKVLTDEEIQSRVKEAMSLVGLSYEEHGGKSPFQLSGGQKRRVAIAGIIVTRPEILILDEPSSGLDPKGKQEILQLIRNLKQTTCDTIIMISHDMDEIAENCDTVAVIADGGVFACESPKELFLKDKELTQLGLDIPIIAKVKNKLATMGVEVEYDRDYKKFAKSVAEALRAKKGGEQ